MGYLGRILIQPKPTTQGDAVKAIKKWFATAGFTDVTISYDQGPWAGSFSPPTNASALKLPIPGTVPLQESYEPTKNRTAWFQAKWSGSHGTNPILIQKYSPNSSDTYSIWDMESAHEDKSIIPVVIFRGGKIEKPTTEAEEAAPEWHFPEAPEPGVSNTEPSEKFQPGLKPISQSVPKSPFQPSQPTEVTVPEEGRGRPDRDRGRPGPDFETGRDIGVDRDLERDESQSPELEESSQQQDPKEPDDNSGMWLGLGVLGAGIAGLLWYASKEKR